MKSIYDKKNLVLQVTQQKCEHFQAGRCTAEFCVCNNYAIIWGYILSVVPETYQLATLQDFTGMYNGTTVLSTSALRKARNQLISYCWKNIAEGEDYDFNTWSVNTILPHRLKTGSSLVIYGNPWSNEHNSSVKIGKKKIGKTLLASIVMKEAIFLRHKPEHRVDSYAWTNYKLLCNRLMANASSGEYEEAIREYYEADWLVVDQIEPERNSENGRQFRINVLDQFFLERMEKNLPSILVFQEDISNTVNFSNEYGSVLYDLVNNRKTHHVTLI